MTKRRDDGVDKSGADEAAARHKQHLDDWLDEALKETFPASDPIAITPRRRRFRRADAPRSPASK